MSDVQYKYRLNELMARLPRSVKVQHIIDLLEKHYSISSAAFYRHRTIPLGSPIEMQEAALAKYAAFFGVSEAELRNYQVVEDRKTVYQLLQAAAKASVAEISHLAGMSSVG